MGHILHLSVSLSYIHQSKCISVITRYHSNVLATKSKKKGLAWHLSMYYIFTENVCPILLAEVSYKWIKRKQKQLMYCTVLAVHLQLTMQPSFHQWTIKEAVNVCTFVISSLWLHVRVWLWGFFFFFSQIWGSGRLLFPFSMVFCCLATVFMPQSSSLLMGMAQHSPHICMSFLVKPLWLVD